MQYRLLGKTGLKISSIGLGKFQLLHQPAISSDERRMAFRLMDEAYERGINYFDTSNNYGSGSNEQLIGEWLKEKGSSVRDQLIIGTKVYSKVGDGVNDKGLSRRHIFQQIEKSLKRLQLDHVDLYWTHAPDPDTSLEETYRAIDDLVRQGKVRSVGCSNIEGWRMAKILGLSQLHHFVTPVAVQNPYNLIQWGDERNLFPLCNEDKLAYFAYSPTEGGFLTGKYRYDQTPPTDSRLEMMINKFKTPKPLFWREEVFTAVDRFVKQAQARNLTSTALSLAWVMSSPNVTVTLVGPRNVEHMKDVWTAFETKLSPEDRARLKENFPAPYTFD